MNTEFRIKGRKKGAFRRLFHASYFTFHTASFQQGQLMTLTALMFMLISLTLGLGIAQPVVRQVASARSLENGALSLYAAEGVAQDVAYRLLNDIPVDLVETLAVGTATGTATMTAFVDGREVIAAGNKNGFARKSRTNLLLGRSASFYYGMQSGVGGIQLNNGSSISGAVQSDGPVVGSGSNLITGGVVSTGPSGRIEKVHVTNAAHAHAITDAQIDGDAYYQTLLRTSLGGTGHANSSDQATSSLPISDATIAQWEGDAAAGGTYTGSCPYVVPNGATLGPIKIPCDTVISDATVTLGGAVWVVGTITVSDASVVKVDASLAGRSVVVIADDASDHSGGSTITLANTALFQGSGTSGSYVLMVSQNNSAENGGSTRAIRISNSVQGNLLLYAGHGKIELLNSVSLKEVTAYAIQLGNTAKVIYETGLSKLLFTYGPAAGYIQNGWREVE